MKDTVKIAKQAAKEIESFLENKPENISVTNVEKDEIYQKKDIDVIWKYKINNTSRETNIEIKGDTYDHTGNFFFETMSNRELNKPGCFMYTEADFLFYYFINTKVLYLLPMPKTREWFLKNESRFVEKMVSTEINGEIVYTSLGKLVPRNIVMKEVLGTKMKKIM